VLLSRGRKGTQKGTPSSATSSLERLKRYAVQFYVVRVVYLRVTLKVMGKMTHNAEMQEKGAVRETTGKAAAQNL
jgi:hypothetical protein